NRNSSVPVDVEAAAGTQRVLVDERSSARAWVLLGTFDLDPGLRTVRFSRRTSTPGWIVADAIKVEPVRPTATASLGPSGDGWALTARQLSRTADAGSTWRSIEPSGNAARSIRAVDFADAFHGRALALEPGSARLDLLTTEDGGTTWTRSPVPGPSAYRGSIAVPGLPSFVDPSTAVLPVTLAGKRSALEFATSADSGRSWSIAAAIPTQRPLTRAKALPADVVDAGTWLAALE